MAVVHTGSLKTRGHKPHVMARKDINVQPTITLHVLGIAMLTNKYQLLCSFVEFFGLQYLLYSSSHCEILISSVLRFCCGVIEVIQVSIALYD